MLRTAIDVSTSACGSNGIEAVGNVTSTAGWLGAACAAAAGVGVGGPTTAARGATAGTSFSCFEVVRPRPFVAFDDFGGLLESGSVAVTCRFESASFEDLVLTDRLVNAPCEFVDLLSEGCFGAGMPGILQEQGTRGKAVR